MDICMDKLAPIKQQCLKLTNCSFKKAQSGSENPATLASRPSSCFNVTSGRVFLNGKSVRSCWTHRDKIFISLAWGIFFLLFRNICFQLQRGHGASCLFFTDVYKCCLETFPDWGNTGIHAPSVGCNLESRLPIRSHPSSQLYLFPPHLCP